ncbi:cytochrome P450 2H2-like [Lingula anatina]|uniref:Cytochrome P450 2H2-like n=1 Tax=Lingula anatina TaxID=7574 RepID=A0A1S3H5T1_LINAN|nr:cytochrome P450 2H2-like [Lingula anatina]|eukprot:XP_013381480.1 cytochrome P450 2H2-like [Lingula anatina]
MQAKDFMKLSQKHGSVFSLRLGVLDMVIINGYDAIHEAFSEKAELFTGRPHDLIYIIQKGIGKKGLIMNEGPSWHELRKMIAVAFRDFGVGKKTLEERILDECQALFEIPVHRQAVCKTVGLTGEVFSDQCSRASRKRVSIFEIHPNVITDRRHDRHPKRLERFCQTAGGEAQGDL